MILNGIEPFVVLPYKEEQNIVFYANKSMKLDIGLVRELVYNNLSNKIIKDNLVRVIIRINYVIIIHIYPTNFKEICSGRLGQNLIIGYIIKKSLFKDKNKLIVNAVNIFFDTLKKCFDDNSINSVPTKFLDVVNNCSNIKSIVRLLEESRHDMIKILGKRYYYKTEHIISYKSIKTYYKSKDFRNYDLPLNERLEYLYNYIKDNLSLFDQFWILINCNDTTYYGLKRVHVLFF